MADMIQRFHDLATFCVGYKILFEFSVVDGDLAAPGSNANSGNRRLAASGTEAVTADFVFLYEHMGINSKSDEWVR
jgi:hypothetical protein